MTITMENIKDISIILGAIMGVIAFFKIIITPFLKAINARREEDFRFHKSLEEKMEKSNKRIEEKLLDNSNAIHKMTKTIRMMQRERLESAYHIYVKELGYCPPGEKIILKMMYEDYEQSNENHIAKNYVQQIEALPNHPKGLPGWKGVER